MNERDVLKKLVAAIDFRNAVLVSGELDKLAFAHDNLWEMVDLAKTLLASPITSAEANHDQT